MDTIFEFKVKLRYVTLDRVDMEFVVIEKVRTASPRPVCTLQVGHAVSNEDLQLLLQIIDDCCVSAIGHTIGLQSELEF